MPNELHIALQKHYAGEDGLIETRLDGYVIDVLRDDVVYEIQTRSFSAISAKLAHLAKRRRVVLVYPLPASRSIVRLDAATGEELSTRRSPKRWKLVEVFREMPHVARHFPKTGLELEVAWTIERELRSDDGQGSWRRKGVSLKGRELVEVVKTERFAKPADFLALLPPELPTEFTVADLAQAAGIGRWLAGKMAYSLRLIGTIRQTGKRGNAFVYECTGKRKRHRRPGPHGS
jgi:hypothetical protein